MMCREPVAPVAGACRLLIINELETGGSSTSPGQRNAFGQTKQLREGNVLSFCSSVVRAQHE